MPLTAAGSRNWLRLVLTCGTLLALLHACSGSEFSSDQNASNLGADSGGLTGTGICMGPEDCDDRDPCTVDVCKATGECEHLATCQAGERCCEGRCGECCDDAECDDGVSCTVDRCFLGACVAMADDGACGNEAIEMYCSLTGDCRAREPCTGSASGECDDAEACTDDSCVGGLCSHDPCSSGTVCCPDTGCSECCSDSQCDDDDPCTVDSCAAGGCQHTPLCADGEQCCPHPLGATASCGGCCTREDCDDQVGCTVDACVQGQCSNVPANNACPGSQVCTATGCTSPQTCEGDEDCESPNPCLSGRCQGGICEFAGCQDSLCCSNGCQQCCGNADCNDNDACTTDTCAEGSCVHADVQCAQRCDEGLGCIECENASDCDDDSECTTDSCDANHKCQHVLGACETGRCCGKSCQQCCSSNDCAADAVANGGSESGEPCSPCVGGECGKVVYCGAAQHCCNGVCLPLAQLCPAMQ